MSHVSYICLFCNKEYPKPVKLRQHIETHLSIRKWKCDKCDKMFYRKGALTTHALIHEKIEYKCEICHDNFSNKNNLDRHKWTYHPND